MDKTELTERLGRLVGEVSDCETLLRPHADDPFVLEVAQMAAQNMAGYVKTFKRLRGDRTALQVTMQATVRRLLGEIAPEANVEEAHSDLLLVKLGERRQVLVMVGAGSVVIRRVGEENDTAEIGYRDSYARELVANALRRRCQPIDTDQGAC
ncbi:MAG: hypothetical protein U0871_05255 [Gemmataceae bacterium]